MSRKKHSRDFHQQLKTAIKESSNGDPYLKAVTSELEERFCPICKEWCCVAHHVRKFGAGGSDANNENRSFRGKMASFAGTPMAAAIAIIVAAAVGLAVKMNQDGVHNIQQLQAFVESGKLTSELKDQIKDKSIEKGTEAIIDSGSTSPASSEPIRVASTEQVPSSLGDAVDLKATMELAKTTALAESLAVQSITGGIVGANNVPKELNQFETPKLSQAEKDVLKLEIDAEDPNLPEATESRTAQGIVSNVEPRQVSPQFPESHPAQQNGTAWPTGSPAIVSARASGSFPGVTGEDPLALPEPGLNEYDIQNQADNLGIDGPFSRLADPTPAPTIPTEEPGVATEFGLSGTWQGIVLAFIALLFIRKL